MRATRRMWDSPLSWGCLVSGAVLLAAFVVWQHHAEYPLLPLLILRDRDRIASFASVIVAGIGMFAVLLFVTYFVQSTLGYSPVRTGVAFLPMIATLVLAAQLGNNVFVPRLGPKVMVPLGMVLAAIAMVLFTRLQVDSGYTAGLLLPLVFIGAGMGTIMPASVCRPRRSEWSRSTPASRVPS
ncbi:hypothetical protein ACQP1G_42600 [Nocardia sp. CA-107356]|uniref:hypothetical protein n=1 Tax=Nocardia sp. CA-107356 TaxID=3239972 RepID=UPI003D89B23A